MREKDRIHGREDGNEALLRVLSAHFKVLTLAGSSEALLRQYSALLKFLKHQPASFLERSAQPVREREKVSALHDLPQHNILRVSLEELEMLVNAEETSRRELEKIAVERFSVPRGSMRSFSNRSILVDKLRSLIENERAHQIIGAVARGEIGKPE